MESENLAQGNPQRESAGGAFGIRYIQNDYRYLGFDDGGRRFRHAPTMPWACRAVDGVESVLGPPPVDTIGAAEADRRRLGRYAFAAPLPAVRLRPMGGFLGADRCLRRMPSEDAFVLPEFAPEGAGRRCGRLVAHRLRPGLVQSAQYGAKPGFARGSGGTVQPPPSAAV
jgi:hypothetical protein